MNLFSLSPRGVAREPSGPRSGSCDTCLVAGPSRAVEELIAPAVAETVSKLATRPEDAAAIRLAERYAAALDDAVLIAIGLGELDELLPVSDEDGRKTLFALSKRVEAQAVLAELGPKLLAVLESLGASPKARAAVAGKGGAPRDPSARRSALDGQRADYVAGLDGTAAVDTPAS